MTYAAVYAASQDEAFQGRCMAACWDIATDISNESPSTENHRARMDWAREVVRGSAAVTKQQLAVVALTNAVIAANPTAATDSDIKYQLTTQLALLIQIG